MSLGKRVFGSAFIALTSLTIQVIVLSVSPSPVRAQGTCSKLRVAESHARTLVQADTAGINQLKTGFTVNAASLDVFLKMTADQRSELYKTAVLNLLQTAVAVPFVGAKVGNVSLPNGVASLGTGQANALIKTLRSKGIEDPALFNLISGAARISNKPALAKEGQKMVGYSIASLQGEHDAINGDKAKALAAVGQLGLTLMGPAYDGYVLWLGAGSDVLTLAEAGYVASGSGAKISKLEQLNAVNLSELNRRLAKLKADVQALQIAKAQSASCTSPAEKMPTDTDVCREANKSCAGKPGSAGDNTFKQRWDKWSKCDDQNGMCKYNCKFGPQPSANVWDCLSKCAGAFQCGEAPVAK